MKSAWLWDSRLTERQATRILKDERDPRFTMVAEKLFSRMSVPREVFKFIDKQIFCRNWHLIKKRIKRDEWFKHRATFWQIIYECILKDLRAQRIKVRRNLPIVRNRIRKSISNQIRFLRLKQGNSQKEMARKMGVIQQYVSKLEAGRENYSVQTLQQIARALNKKLIIKFQ